MLNQLDKEKQQQCRDQSMENLFIIKFQDDKDIQQEEKKFRGEKMETLKEKIEFLDSKYQIKSRAYDIYRKKEFLTQQMQEKNKQYEYEKDLIKQVECQKQELTNEYQKQVEQVNNRMENKKYMLEEQMDQELNTCLEREKMYMVKQLENDLENYKQQREQQNKSRLNLLNQKLYLNRLINLKKIFSQKNLDENQNDQLDEKIKYLIKELNQYRIQIVESIEQNIYLLDKLNIVEFNKQKAHIIKQNNSQREYQQNQINEQIIQQQNKKKLIDQYIKQTFENHLIHRKNLKEKLFQEEIKNIQNRELKLASYFNLDCQDQEIKQIKIDNKKQLFFQKQLLKEYLRNNLTKFKNEIQDKYRIMKNNLIEQQMEKLENEKSAHGNNPKHRQILDLILNKIKLQKFIDEITMNNETLKIEQLQIQQQLEDLQMTSDQYQGNDLDDQNTQLNSDLKVIKNHLKELTLQDYKTTQELKFVQKQLYQLVSKHQYKQYKSQMIYLILQNINGMNDNFNDGRIDQSQDMAMFYQSEQQDYQEIPQIVVQLDNLDEINLKQMKKWICFLLNQRIIWYLEEEICKKEKEKLKYMGIKVKKDIIAIEKQFKEQNIIKHEKDIKLNLLEIQGQILKYQQSQIAMNDQKVNEWDQVLKQRKRILDRMNFYTSNQKIPIFKLFDTLEQLYNQYTQIQQVDRNLQQQFYVEALSKYKIQLPSQYSFISQKQNFDLQYILLI